MSRPKVISYSIHSQIVCHTKLRILQSHKSVEDHILLAFRHSKSSLMPRILRMKVKPKFELLWPYNIQDFDLPLTVWVLHLYQRIAAVYRAMLDGARVADELPEGRCIWPSELFMYLKIPVDLIWHARAMQVDFFRLTFRGLQNRFVDYLLSLGIPQVAPRRRPKSPPCPWRSRLCRVDPVDREARVW